MSGRRFEAALLTVLLLAAVQVHGDEADDDVDFSLDDVVSALEPLGKNCVPPPTKEQIEELVLSEQNPQMGTKCFRQCLFKQFDLIPEGKTEVDIEKSLEMLNMAFGTDRDADLTQILEKCNKENSGIAEKCENAHAHGMCMLREMKAQGFDVPEVKRN